MSEDTATCSILSKDLELPQFGGSAVIALVTMLVRSQGMLLSSSDTARRILREK
jgi:hypothetical protein